MDESDPLPTNPLEKIFSKLTLAQRANTAIQRQAHEKLDALSRRLEAVERKIDSLIELVRHGSSTTRIVIEKISIVQDHARNSIEELREIRRVVVDSARTLAVTSRDVEDAKDDIGKVREITGTHSVPTREELEAEVVDKAYRSLGKTIVKGAKHALPYVLTSGAAAGLFHAVMRWLGH